MKKSHWNPGWIFYKEGAEKEKRIISLPHDAMIEEKRVPDMENGSASGFYPGGKYFYEKTLVADKELAAKSVILEFEGIYMNSSVFLNNEKVGGWIYGYTNFFIELTGKLKEGENQITVIADNSQTPNSRWYTGSGIYRDVNLYIGGKNHFIPDKTKITTLSVNPAVIRIEAATTVKNAKVKAEILRNGKFDTSVRGSGVLELKILNAELWSAENPNLYEVRLSLYDGDNIVDTENIPFGIRKLDWSAADGFTVNGETVKLRGGCIHHDNGLLGACEYDKAAYRKIKRLKEFGFNAIRYSHYPASKAILKACDELGMYVLDESFDQWRIPQTKYDYALHFDKEWEKDIDAMVDKDYNHPSVVMYCIGNEISDIVFPYAADVAKALYGHIKKADNTRPVFIANNCLLNLLAVKMKEAKENAEAAGKEFDRNNAGSQEVNELVAALPKIMASLNAEIAESLAGEVFESVDIAGYNYGNGLFDGTHRIAPKRIILGSETFPARIGTHWQEVVKNPHIIGDFMWTAWDYIGEAGVGLPFYGSEKAPFSKPYPCMLASCGSFDITGFAESQAYYGAIVWGVYQKPYIAVRPLNHSGEKYTLGNWRLTDAVNSWSWDGQEGKQAEIEVYSIGQEIELFQDGKSLGRKALENCRAKFNTEYQKGKLEAVSYDGNRKVIERAELISANNTLYLRAYAEEIEIGTNDFTYINVELTDENGIVKTLCDRKVSVKVEGAGRLKAVGSGNALTEEYFNSNEYTTYNGRMQAIIESQDKTGETSVTFSADGTKDIKVQIKERGK